jgi:hypothetical protein
MLPRRDTDKEQSGLGIPERVSVADPRTSREEA